MDPRYWHKKKPDPEYTLVERIQVVIQLIEQELKGEPGFKFRCFAFESHREFLPTPLSEAFRGADCATDRFMELPLGDHGRISEFYRPRVVKEWEAMLGPLRAILEVESRK
jgi:hypothetical protein